MGPIGNVERVTVHFTNGTYIDFGPDEVSVNHVETIQKDAEGKVETPVEYYIITTTMIER